MKKLVRTSLNNVANKRGVRDLNIQLYSHDKNNAGFEFVIKNEVDLSEYKAKVLFDFQESFATWETKGTVEGNVVKVKFDTTFITKCEEVIGYLFLDSETDTLDVFKFKFNVVLSEIDKYDIAKRGFRYIKDQEVVDVITRSELQEELAKLQVNGGVDLSNYLTTKAAEEMYAKKSELPTPYNDSALVERVTNLENKTDKDTVYNDTEVKERLTTLENKPPVDLSNYALKSEIPTPYNDSELVQKIGQLEARVDKDTVYDDAPLKERVTALESKAIEGGAYDDTHLRERLDTLEAKQDKDTVYNDEEVKQRLTVLENKPVVDTSHFITDETLDNKNYLTTTVAEETYAKKSEIPQAYNDSALVERVTTLENRPTTGGSVDTSNLVTKDELKNQHYVTQDSLPIPLYKEYTSDDFNEYSKQDYGTFLIHNTRLRGKVFLNPNYAYTNVSPLVYTGDGVVPKTAEYDAVLYTVASSLPDGYRLESINENVDNKVTFLSNKNFSEVVPKEELKNIIREVGGTGGTSENIDVSHFITEETLENKGYATVEQVASTYATKSEIPQPYSDTELVKRITVLENKQDNDTIYDDTDLKNRVVALENRPTGGGTQVQDTGWIKLSDETMVAGSIVEIRRIDNTVNVRFRNEQGNHFIVNPQIENNTILSKQISTGFGSVVNNSLMILNSDKSKSLGVVSTEINNGNLQITTHIASGASSEFGVSVYINEFSYITDEPFPTNLH